MVTLIIIISHMDKREGHKYFFYFFLLHAAEEDIHCLRIIYLD